MWMSSFFMLRSKLVWVVEKMRHVGFKQINDELVLMVFVIAVDIIDRMNGVY